MNGRAVSPLFSFDFLFDTDMGLILFIKNFLQVEEAFDLNILNQDVKELYQLIANREEQNPLSVISTKDNMQCIKDLYEDFMDYHKNPLVHEAIISNSPSTRGLNLLKYTLIVKQITPSIWVSNAHESKKLEAVLKSDIVRVNIIEKPKLHISDVDQYSAIYFKNASDIINLHNKDDDINPPISKHNIFVADTPYNKRLLEKGDIISRIIMQMNRVGYTSIIKREEGEMNNEQ